jgi:hypothetical protein
MRELIDHSFCRDAAKRREGVLMTSEGLLHGLRGGEQDVHQPTAGKHHDQEGETPARVAHRDGAEGSPIDLRALAGAIGVGALKKRPDRLGRAPREVLDAPLCKGEILSSRATVWFG